MNRSVTAPVTNGRKKKTETKKDSSQEYLKTSNNDNEESSGLRTGLARPSLRESQITVYLSDSGNLENVQVIRVYLMDGSYKAIKIDPSATTVEELWEIVAEKLMLTPFSSQMFFIWGVSGDLELLLFTHQKISEVTSDWHIFEDRYNPQASRLTRSATGPQKISKTSTALPQMRTLTRTMSTFTSKLTKSKTYGAQAGAMSALSMLQSQLDSEEFKLMFRTTAVVPLQSEEACTDPGAVHLFYIQAVFHVIRSNYPCDVQTAIQLGGIQLQLNVGNRNPQVHRPGYLREILAQYVPEHLVEKMPAAEWERMLYTEHENHRDKDNLYLKQIYLKLVRQWKHYGCTFFKAQYRAPESLYYKHEYEGDVRLGINQNGLHVIDPRELKIISFSFNQILEWDSEKDVFWVVVKEEIPKAKGFLTVKANPNREYYFKSPQAELLNDLLWDWSDTLGGVHSSSKSPKQGNNSNNNK